MKLTDYLAIYGALLSTATATWTTIRSLPKIRIKLVFAIESLEGKAHTGIGISIQNPSTHIAHITNVSILYPFERARIRDRVKQLFIYKRIPYNHGWCHGALSTFDIDDGCPVSIDPGKSHWVFLPYSAIEKVLTDALSPQIKIVVQDALWRNKYSKAFKLAFRSDSPRR